ncbi:MAG: substrate-binding domain-containing protein [Geothrix sp.]|uniref:substrate-binding domain-containing protein n=1 Tax=Geothrix sp. TaxID=1962974 RepID=UPI00183FB5EC|nr:substrate-binding domain-containing protein [Geothrix sp.]NWJ40659.1 substrate-binding domain-containing protein [Geothrix sp.]WIL21332.1 MAG: substrate-binding domain-containing protein [Geothrix sp.]
MQLRRNFMKSLALAVICSGLAMAQDIKIAHVYDKTGVLGAYAKQTQDGLLLGLEYATKGTMMVNGHKLVVIEKDTQGKPDVAKSMLEAAYADDKAAIAIGPTSSGAALAMLPVAEQFKKILLVEPAVADDITGIKWNRYIFRTGRCSSQDAVSNAIVLDKKGVNIATMAQDNAFGRDFVAAFRGSIKNAKLVHEEYLPPATSDFTAGAQRLFDKLKGLPGRKIIFINWAGSNAFKIADLKPERYGIEIATGGNILPALALYKPFPGLEGAAYYYYESPKNKVNDWFVAEHKKRFNNVPPDFFTAGGMAAGIAVVEALKKTSGSVDTEKLIATMEGMAFETPKGKMIFRKEDHQALQSMYHFKIKVDPAVAWAIPELVREIKIDEMVIPIRNKR